MIATNPRGRRARKTSFAPCALSSTLSFEFVGLNHGQLSDLRKRVIMAGDEPYTIDF
jgi:predicted Ser/Thr protein kinase